MKIGIIGAGALGALFSHMFYRAEIEFSIYEKDETAINAIESDGLTLTENGIQETIFPVISPNPDILSDADIVFLFVKSYSTGDAVKSVTSSLDADAIVVSLQNGLGNFEAIAEYIDEKRIVFGTTTMGATKTGPSSVTPGGKGYIKIGSSSIDSLNAAASLLEMTGLAVTKIDNPRQAVWEKAVINAAINPIASVLNILNGEIPVNPYALTLQETVTRESVSAAGAAGIIFDSNSMMKEVKDVCEKTSVNTCSMLQDLKNGRRTEIDSINGVIIETASKHGISVPVTESLYLLIKAMELKNSSNQ